MNSQALDKLIRSVLYEGYMLYPYRRSALKNKHAWNFGVVNPRGIEPSSMTTECLARGRPATSLFIEVRFLQLHEYDEPVERRVVIGCSLGEGCACGITREFEFGKLYGSIEVSAIQVAPDAFKLRVDVSNYSAIRSCKDPLLISFVSTHTILNVLDGEFVSLLDPPADLAAAAQSCKNVGTWPVLVGKESERDCILSSPIILYDYPRIAPESPGDLFDGTEIDELLTLRILTLTDAEKDEIRRGDTRTREMLERVEALTPEDLLKLHGTIRSCETGFKRGDRVRLHPKPHGDAFDTLLAGRIAIIESIEQDFEDRVHVAVVIEDDPGIDLGFARQPGHRFFFSAEELELLR